MYDDEVQTWFWNAETNWGLYGVVKLHTWPALTHGQWLISVCVGSRHPAPSDEHMAFASYQFMICPPVAAHVRFVPLSKQLAVGEHVAEHVPRQFTVPPGQEHTPPEQTPPAAQRKPHDPQLFGSLDVSAPPPQVPNAPKVPSGLQEAVWVPVLHVPQLCVAGVHAQTPLWQVIPGAHALPHDPQFASSDCRSAPPLHCPNGPTVPSELQVRV